MDVIAMKFWHQHWHSLKFYCYQIRWHIYSSSSLQVTMTNRLILNADNSKEERRLKIYWQIGFELLLGNIDAPVHIDEDVDLLEMRGRQTECLDVVHTETSETDGSNESQRIFNSISRTVLLVQVSPIYNRSRPRLYIQNFFALLKRADLWKILGNPIALALPHHMIFITSESQSCTRKGWRINAYTSATS